MIRGVMLLLLLAPSSCTAQPDSPAEGAAGEVPFEFPRNQVLLPLTLGGEGPFFFLLDTGVNPSAVDIALARRLSLPLDTTRAGTAGGAGAEAVAVHPATVRGLRVAERDIEDFPAVAVDLSPLSEPLGRPLHGILGYSFLRERVVQIDYPARVVRLLPRGDPRADLPHGAEGMRLPLVLRPNDVIPVVDIRLNDHPVTVSLDTGSSLTLEIFRSAVEPLGLDEVYERAVAVELAGARGAFEARAASVDSIGFGPFVVQWPEITFSERSPRAEEGRLGNMGNGLLQQFVLTLDYPQKQITIYRPRP